MSRKNSVLIAEKTLLMETLAASETIRQRKLSAMELRNDHVITQVTDDVSEGLRNEEKKLIVCAFSIYN